MNIIKIVSLLVLINFTPSYSQDINNLISEVFNESEIYDLKKIETFFINKICIKNKKNHVKCFNKYFENIGKAKTTGNFDLMIPFSEQKNLYSNIKKSTFDEIWIFEEYKNEINQKENKKLRININGKYFKFLENLSYEYSEIKDYCEFIESNGDYSVALISESFGQLSENDIMKLKDKRMELVSIIFFLTLNDQLKRR
jgi:uncharacterized protein YozE (UPF0346 family)